MKNPHQPATRILHDALVLSGFDYNKGEIIHLFSGGSNQHGGKGRNSGSDLDICGVYIESPEIALGIDKAEHYVTSTGDQDRRNTADDTDVSLYSLRKWAFLAAKGNPTVLSYLFMPAMHGSVWKRIYVNRRLFIAKSHVQAFVGFGRNQLKRMQGLKGNGKHGQRDEIIEAKGYDTKAAMHMIRMMLECRELLQTGEMTFPNPEAGLLTDIREGEFTQKHLEHMFICLEDEVLHIADKESTLPGHVDREAISGLVSGVYLKNYEMRYV